MIVIEIFRLFGRILVDNAEAEKSISSTESGFEKLGRKMTDIGNKVSDVGKSLTARVTAPIAALGALVTKIGVDFDMQMSKVAAVSGATGKSFESLRDMAQELGRTTQFTATQAAEGMEYLALAGWKTDQILSAMPGMLNLAAAGALDLGKAADITSDVMSAFGISAEKASHTADVFAYAQANANTNVEQMGEAMTYLAPVANALGWELEESAAAVMKLADSGVKGSMAGQAFASSLSRLAKPTRRMTNTMKQLGIEFFDAEGNMKSMPDLIAEIEKGTKGMTREQKSATLSILFGAEAYKHWAILLESGSDVLAKTTDQLKNADGAAEKMAQTMMDNLGGALITLKSALEGLAIQFSDLMKDDIRRFADWLTDLVRKFSSLDEDTKKLIITISGIAAAIGPVMIVLGTLISTTGTVISTVASLGGAIAGAGGVIGLLTGPIGIAVASLVGLGIAVKNLYDSFSGDVLPAVDRFGEGISDSTKQALEGFFELSDGAGQALTQLTITGEKVSEKMKDVMVGNYSDMNNQILLSMQDRHSKELELTKKQFENSIALSSAEEAKILEQVQRRNEIEVEAQKHMQTMINDILSKAAEENRALRENEIAEIERIQQRMNETAIKYLSESELESKAILERMNANASALSAQQAAEVVKNSATQRDGVIKEAEDQYNEYIKNIIRMRDETKDITADQANLMIAEATKQKDVTVKIAEDMHSQIVVKAKESSGEYVDAINWQTGEVLTQWDLFKNRVVEIFTNLKDSILQNDTFKGILENAEKYLTKVVEFLKGQLDKIKQFWDENGQQILEAVTNVFNSIKAVIEFIMPGVKFIIEMVWTAIKQIISGALDVIMGLIKVFSGLFTGDFSKMWEGIKQIFKGAIDVIIGWMTVTFVGGIRTLLTNLAKMGINLVKGLGDGIVGIFKSFTTTGQNLAKGMVDGVVNFFKNLQASASIIFNAIRSTGSSVWTATKETIVNIAKIIWDLVSSHFTGMLNSIKSIFGTVKNSISNIWDGVMSFFKGINLYSIGADIIRGLINGIGSMASAVWDKAKDIANGISDSIKKFFGIRSPSRLMMEYGEYIGEGLAVGIQKSDKHVSKASKDISATVDKQFAQTMQQITKQADNAAAGTKKSADKIKKSFNEAFNAVQHQYKTGSFNSSQYVEALKIVSSNYAKTADQQRKVAEEMVKVEKVLLEEKKKLDKESFEHTKKFIEARREANEISLTQELAAWERVHDRYAKGSEERIEAEKNIHRVRQEIYDQLLQANDDFLKKTQEINKNVEDEEKRLNEVYEKAVEERTKSITDFKGLFDEVVFKAEKTGEDLLSNLRGQVSYIEQWSTTIERLAERGIDKGLLEELRNMGPKAMPELMALNSLTDKQLREYESLWKKKTEDARAIAIKELSGMRTDTDKQISELHKRAAIQLEEVRKEFETKVMSIRRGTEQEFNAMKSTMPQIGKQAMDGLLSGIESMRGPLMSTARSIANEIGATIKKALDVRSPSRVMMEIGKFVGEGLVIGLENMVDKVDASSNKLASAAVPNIPVFKPLIPNRGIFTESGYETAESAQTVARGFSPVINNYFTPAESTPSETARRVKRSMQEAALEWR